jgi:serine/threonine protein kinase/Tfp pilus assembly protein PilF
MLIGQSLGRYEVLELLGEGGMGVVYRALDTQLDREVAVKVIREAATSDPKRIERFEREGRAVARLSHPNILEIYDFGHDQGVSYAVMELLDGETLRHRLIRSKLPQRKLLQIAEEVADGLGAAHREGVVHRDLKPENIFLTSDGRIKILDFGVAHLRSPPQKKTDPTAVTEALTDSGTIVGTLSYMSPEQIRGREVTGQSDIFALGCVLYEMISRRRAFPGGTTAETVAAILEEDPHPLSGVVHDLPFTLEQIVYRCLEKQPADRYESARDVAFALNAAAEALKSGSASQPRPAVRNWRSPRAAAWAFGAALVAAAVTAGVLILRPASVSLPEEKHLAVIGFESATDELDLQQFAAGLTETVADGITLLEEQTLGKLWMVPRTLRSSADKNPIEAIRREYNINLALTGRLERQGEMFSLTLSLVEAESNKVLRSTTIEDDLSNLSSFQVMPLHRVAEMLGVELTRETRDRLAAMETNVTAAFEAYVQARGLVARHNDPADLDSAIELLLTAVGEDPLFQPAGETLAGAYLRKYEETKEPRWIEFGLDRARIVVSQHPTATAYRTLAPLHHAVGENEKAVTALEEAVRLAPASAAAHLELAKAYQELRLPEDARRAYQRAINHRPGCWRCHYDFAYFSYLNGEFDAAANEFRQAIRSAPENFRGYNALGGILFGLDRLDEARELFEQSIEIEPITNYSALSNLGTLYYFAARFSDSTQMYLRALEQDDRDYVVWGNLGFAQTYSSDLEKAEESFRRAIEKATTLLEDEPNDALLLSDLASFHAMIGERDEALAYQESAIAQPPADPEILVTIIETFEIVGNRERALEWTKRALDRGMPADELDRDPTLRGLVADERYRNLVDRSRGGAAEPNDVVPAGS